jgi:hypothetical protein
VILAHVQIPLFEGPEAPVSRRREVREGVVRDVEYCRFPRACADQRPRIGFTRDVSPTGLCLRVDVPEPVGSLLRVVVRGIDGAPRREGITRVTWSRPSSDGGHWLGLALVETGAAQAVRIRYLRRTSASVEVA